MLSLALSAAAKDGRIVRNVSEGGPLPRVVRRPKRYLTHAQVATLADAAAPYQTLIRVLANSGLRWGEASALRVHAVDLERRRLEVDQAHTEVGGKIVVGTTKNHQRRSVPIPRFLAAELSEHLAGKSPADLVLHLLKAASCETPTSGRGSSTPPPSGPAFRGSLRTS